MTALFAALKDDDLDRVYNALYTTYDEYVSWEYRDDPQGRKLLEQAWREAQERGLDVAPPTHLKPKVRVKR